MKKNFFQKTSFTVLNIGMIIVVLSSIILNKLGYMSIKTYYHILIPLLIIALVVYVYGICSMIRHKKLRNKPDEPKVVIDLNAGVFGKPGDAIITIDEFRYLIESPFRKECVTSKKDDTFYSYLSSLRMLKPTSKKMIKWLKKDMRLADTVINVKSLCYFFRDLRVLDGSNPVFLCNAGNDKMMLIMAIEHLSVSDSPRSVEHLTALINTASKHEKANYAGGGLLDAFDVFKNGQMTSKMFKQGNNVLYCFIYKN